MKRERVIQRGRTRRLGMAAALAVVVAALAACEPPPPRLQLTVTGWGSDVDTNPGDGICEAVDRLGARSCTLRAAIDEANATDGGVDILLPRGPVGWLDVTITGDVVLKPAAADRALLISARFTVAAGGRVRAERLENDVLSADSWVRFDVHGSLVLDRSLVFARDLRWSWLHPTPEPEPAIRIRPGGGVVVTGSVVRSDSPAGTIANAGTLVMERSTVQAEPLDIGYLARALVTEPGAVSHVQATGLAIVSGPAGDSACAGVPPTSHGWFHVETSCGSVSATGDSTGSAGWVLNLADNTVTIDPASPLVDAVPLGEAGCEVTAVDVFGAPRGVDGDGDGVGGCDIGAVERQP